MVKSELVKKIAKQFPELSSSQVNNAIDIVFQTMANTLGRGERIEIRNFGTLSVRTYAPSKTRNPKTGKTFTKRRSARVHFKAGVKLKQRVQMTYLLTQAENKENSTPHANQ